MPGTDAAAEYYRQYYAYYYYQQQLQQQQLQQQQQQQPLSQVGYRPPPTPSLAPIVVPPTSYAAAVIQGTQGWRAPPVPQAISGSLSVQPKKPNPSRFESSRPVSLATVHPPVQMTVKPPVPAQEVSKSNGESPWPPSLKSFVERAFSRCESDTDRTFVEKKLKDLISSVTTDGRLHKHRWDLEPTPVPPSASPSPALSTNRLSQQDISALAGGSSYSIASASTDKKRKSRFQSEPPLAVSLPSSSGKGSIYGPSASSNPVTSAEIKTRQQRANRFQKEQDKYGPASSLDTSAVNGGKKKRQRIAVSTPAPTASTTLSEFDLEQLIVVGTCQKVEKDYLRLTSAPAPSTVRPLPVLRQALKLVKEKWEKSKGSPECYVYMCSQLKSLRQDLVVQHIRNGKHITFLENTHDEAGSSFGCCVFCRVHSRCV